MAREAIINVLTVPSGKACTDIRLHHATPFMNLLSSPFHGAHSEHFEATFVATCKSLRQCYRTAHRLGSGGFFAEWDDQSPSGGRG